MKNLFLHGDLEEEIYMEIPSGFDKGTRPNKVCQLKKVLYGLKQSLKAWFCRFVNVMIGLGYKQSQRDHTLLIKHNEIEGVTILLVYVDDVIVTGDEWKREIDTQAMSD